ncbi:MAG: transferase [Gammaproteobacteria bacterium]|nr:MAG: transferase [Gammaproteobacteria bacterium]
MMETPLRIRFIMDCAPEGLELLTPGGSLRWGNCVFDINPPEGGETDFCVVLANATPRDRFRVAPCNTLFIAGEPLEKKLYPPAFYAQFGHVIDTHDRSGHPHLIQSAPGLNWHVGLDQGANRYLYGLDRLRTIEYPQKENRISVVCSDAAHTPGQRKRLALLEYLKRRLGKRLVHFGRGFHPVNDKMEAILPYRYHLVLENSVSRHYWTEKLADAYLGWAFPVYAGCTNIEDYFPRTAFLPIDVDQPEQAERTLRQLLDAPWDESHVPALREARDLVLDRYNPFAWSAHWASRLYVDAESRLVTLRSHKAFRPFPRGLLFRLRSR